MSFRTLATRAAAVSGALLALAVSLFGCNREGASLLDPGEEAVVTFLDSDYTTAELLGVAEVGLDGITEADLEAALHAELSGSWPMPCSAGGADNCFPFSAAGTRWIGARVNATKGTLVSGRSEGSLRDYLVICRGPLDSMTKGFVASNDSNPDTCQNATMCIGDLESCDPVVELEGGTWACFFAVSPQCSTDYPGCSPCFDMNMSEPTGGDLRISVN